MRHLGGDDAAKAQAARTPEKKKRQSAARSSHEGLQPLEEEDDNDEEAAADSGGAVPHSGEADNDQGPFARIVSCHSITIPIGPTAASQGSGSAVDPAELQIAAADRVEIDRWIEEQILRNSSNFQSQQGPAAAAAQPEADDPAASQHTSDCSSDSDGFVIVRSPKSGPSKSGPGLQDRLHERRAIRGGASSSTTEAGWAAFDVLRVATIRISQNVDQRPSWPGAEEGSAA